MGFELFFGLFGLISSNSKSRHKARLESEWRIPQPLNTNLYKEPNPRSPLINSSRTHFSVLSNESKGRIFTTSGPSAAPAFAASEGIFSSQSNSSASSGSSTSSSINSTNSTSAFIKQKQADRYDVRLTLQNEKSPSNSSGSSSGFSSGSSPLLAETDYKPTGGEFPSADAILHEAHEEVSALSSDDQESTKSAARPRTEQLRVLYCLFVCLSMWLHVVRLVYGLCFEKSLLVLDFYALGTYKIQFLVPAICLAIQAAAVSTLFLRNNDETNWLVPFYSSKDYLIRSRSNFKPRIEDYTRRIRISVSLALMLAMVSAISLSAYLVHITGESNLKLAREHVDERLKGQSAAYDTVATIAPEAAAAARQPRRIDGGLQRPAKPLDEVNGTSLAGGAALELAADRTEQLVLWLLLALDILWAIYSTYICFLVSFYFNLICSIMKTRFHGISRVIEDLAESNTTKTTNQARKITTLYLEHNEACELLDESNDFWQYLIFFTYFTYIPAYCYCLYNLFFVDFEAWPSFITWVIHTHTGFIILLISFSAAGVSTEAHAPYTSLHTLSLIQLPLDVEVNIATFLHRVRGLTIGYSCYDLFAITNASMSNTAAACASYFLIVADFSRSSVFTLAQMNGSNAAAAAAFTTPTPS